MEGRLGTVSHSLLSLNLLNLSANYPYHLKMNACDIVHNIKVQCQFLLPPVKTGLLSSGYEITTKNKVNCHVSFRAATSTKCQKIVKNSILVSKVQGEVSFCQSKTQRY